MEAKEKELEEALADARYAGYLSGIKEVVEWIRKRGLSRIQIDYASLQSIDKFADIYEVDPEDLQAFLKERGL